MDDPALGGLFHRAPEAIDLLLVVDAAGILAAHRTLSLDAGSVIAPDLYFLTASSTYVRAGQATKDLSLAVSLPCILRWQGLCVSAQGAAYLVVTDVTVPETDGADEAIFDPVRLEVEESLRPRPVLVAGANTDPPHFSLMEARRFVATTRVRAKGRVEAYLRFYLTEQDADGTPRLAGHFECRIGLTLT